MSKYSDMSFDLLPPSEKKRIAASMSKHRAIESVEIEPDGVWAVLKPGFEGDDGVHSIRAENWSHWQDEKFWIEPGKCEECLSANYSKMKALTEKES